jgi:hypothetical protein
MYPSQHRLRRLLGLTALTVLAGCNSGGISKVPVTNVANLSGIGTLQFAVGTVNVGTDGNKIGLNTVETYRQSNGLSAVLLDTPTITGPSGFVNTAGVDTTSPYLSTGTGANCQSGTLVAGADFGTNAISGDPQNPSVQFRPTHTLGEAALLGSYGIQPFNSTEGANAYYAGVINTIDCGFGWAKHPTYQAYPEPFYLSQAAVTAIEATQEVNPPSYLGGPPAFPFVSDGSAAPGFAGYVAGFTAFELTPVAGTYTLSVNVPASNAASTTATATATLSSLNPLPALPAPTYTSDGVGGGSGTIVVPADPRITETMVYILDQTANNNFSVGPLKGTGAISYTLPDGYGPCIPVGCGKTNPSPSIPSGDIVFVYAASYDYPAFEAAPPASTSAKPTITGSGGQADITLSPIAKATE